MAYPNDAQNCVYTVLSHGWSLWYSLQAWFPLPWQGFDVDVLAYTSHYYQVFMREWHVGFDLDQNLYATKICLNEVKILQKELQ